MKKNCKLCRIFNATDKTKKVICIVLSILSTLTVLTLMFQFFTYEQQINLGYRTDWITVSIYGYDIYDSGAIYLILGILGLIMLLWDLAFGAYTVVDGKNRPLLWKIAKYGYFFGVVMCVINFFLIISYASGAYTLEAEGYFFQILLFVIALLKVYLLSIKEKPTQQTCVQE